MSLLERLRDMPIIGPLLGANEGRGLFDSKVLSGARINTSQIPSEPNPSMLKMAKTNIMAPTGVESTIEHGNQAELDHAQRQRALTNPPQRTRKRTDSRKVGMRTVKQGFNNG